MVTVAEYPDAEPAAGQVRVRTVLSGISAGTELTQYRGTIPYLERRWDGAHRVFVDGVPPLTYPVDTWGYQEVGRVDAVGPEVDVVAVGAIVWGGGTIAAPWWSTPMRWRSASFPTASLHGWGSSSASAPSR